VSPTVHIKAGTIKRSPNVGERLLESQKNFTAAKLSLRYIEQQEELIAA
jgi:hypothetical protein